MKKYAEHEGFTLVELLIVVVTIAILSMTVMLSDNEASTSARAAAIISDFENIKAAAAAYYLDNARKIEKNTWTGFGASNPDTYANELWGYLSKNSAVTAKLRPYNAADNKGDYKYSLGGKYNTNWFVWCQVPDSKVMKKLKTRKVSLGLCAPKDGDYYAAESIDLDVSSTKFIGICIH